MVEADANLRVLAICDLLEFQPDAEILPCFKGLPDNVALSFGTDPATARAIGSPVEKIVLENGAVDPFFLLSRIILSPVDHNLSAHSRCPIDMIFHG